MILYILLCCAASFFTVFAKSPGASTGIEREIWFGAATATAKSACIWRIVVAKDREEGARHRSHFSVGDLEANNNCYR
jgi:hypothetical protein